MLDYYGRRLATCSSDKTIKIFEVDGETHRLTETLRGYSRSHYFEAERWTNLVTVMMVLSGVLLGFVTPTRSGGSPELTLI